MSNVTIEQNSDKFRGVWKPNTFYAVDDMVFVNGALQIALADFTSGATFDEVNWFCPQCPKYGWDIMSATGPSFALSDFGYTVTNTNGAYKDYIATHRSRNPSEYFWVEQMTQGLSVNSYFIGVTWSTSRVPDIADTFQVMRNGFMHVNDTYIGTSAIALNSTRSHRAMVIRNNNVYVGSMTNAGAASFNGDPVAETGYDYTIPSSNPVRIITGVYSSGVTNLNAQFPQYESNNLYGAGEFEN